MPVDTSIFQERRYKYLVDSMRPTPSFALIVGALTLGILFGASGYVWQLMNGLTATNLNYRQFWGMYIVNFVFFIGIAEAAAVISAILRITGASWRAPIVRIAESITLFSLIVGASMILIDMGKVDRIYNIILYFNLTSPILWDFLSVSTYLFGSILFLLLPMIPDNGLLRDYYREELQKVSGKGPLIIRARYHLHRILAFNWRGTDTQVKRLDKGIKIMSLLIIPIGVSVHTVVSFVFSMMWRPGWHSSIFGPYFVVGAIYSGMGVLVASVVIFRKIYHLEDFITPKQISNLGLLTLAFVFMYLYFTTCEYLTSAYTSFESDRQILQQVFYGQYAWGFWFFVILGLFIPGIIYAYPKTRFSPFWAAFGGFLVTAGMWVKRFIIVVPTVSAPVYSDPWLVYNPSWIELGITLAGTCGFLAMFYVFTKVFPIVAIYEVREYEKEMEEHGQMVTLYNRSKRESSRIRPSHPTGAD